MNRGMETGDQVHAARHVSMILEQLDAIPTLSPVAARLMTLGSADDVDVDEVVELIETDPALTTTVLGLCRRADRGLGDRIDTVRRAVVMLGFEQVRSAALGVCVYDLLDEHAADVNPGAEFDETPAAFDRPGLWRHSVAVATAAELICERFPAVRVRPDLAFVSGLLHDVGKIVLELTLPKAIGRVAAAAERRGMDFAPAARALIGIDQHTAGRRVAERWLLPQPIAEVMWLYGQPPGAMPRTENRRLIAVVNLAIALTRANHLGWSCDFGPGTELEEAAVAAGVNLAGLGGGLEVGTGGGLAALVEATVEMTARRCNALRIDSATPPQVLMGAVASANKRLSSLNAQYERESRASARRGGVLQKIAQFQKSWDPRRGVTETLELIARSAAGVMGDGFYASVYQASAGDPWQVLRFNESGRIVRRASAEPPPGTRLRGESLAKIAGGGELAVATMGVLPWLSDYLNDAPDLRRVRMLGICGGDDDGSPSAVLLHDRDTAATVGTGPSVEALVGAWASAVCAASAAEESRELGERLVERSRDLAEAQALLTQRESFARLGEMTAGAAHEMNNPLTVIRGRAQLLVESAGTDLDRANASAVADAAADLSRLIEGLHTLADPPASVVRPVAIGSVLALALERVADRTGTHPDIGGLTESGARTLVHADRELVAAALSEVLLNACEACAAWDGQEHDHEAGGQTSEDHVDVETSACSILLGVQHDPADGRVLLSVTDDGPGFTARGLRHACDPFFSEKTAGRQTGLGLSRARRGVEACGGFLRLENPAEGGARVTLELASAEENRGPAAFPRTRDARAA